jgi:hypothetical protein
MTNTKYFVVAGHTLCYQQPGMVDLGILHASPLKGSPYDRLQGVIPMPMDQATMRPATVQDFHDFRVSPAGHI